MSEIKQGYKQTKVGIIPEDWDVGGLSKIANVEMGQSPLGDTYNTEQIGVALINGPTEFTVRYPIKKQWTSKPTKLCKKGDILICVRGSSTGRINISNDEYCIGRGVAAISNKKQKGNIDFIEQILNILSEKILKLTSGSTFPNIDKKTLNEFSIPLPPLKEQEKIAEILTTWDEAITKQTELLRAKELLKIALMQKLLSGEVRFSGFSDEWEEIRLGKYIKEISKKNKENVELVLSVTNKHGFIAQKDYFEKEVASKDTSNYKIVKKGNFAYNPSRINVGSLGLLEEYEIGILSPMYVIFECLKGLDKQYLNYWLNTHNFTGNLSKFLSGSVRDSLAFNDMKLMKIKLPSLPEQQKIAEVLSLADDEINLLKNELEELKLQKKALMQKLLTGEVRVKV
ncbi:MAG: restriction endonuclease subunit S [Arcobacteraceae bacterium]|nr:restriction endonuclease subunit S [Arcobacteraceae bacterium]